MGKYALILTAALGFTAVISTQASLNDSLTTDSAGLRDHELHLLAREAAMSGFNEAVYVLEEHSGADSIGVIRGQGESGDYVAMFDVIQDDEPYEAHIRIVGTAEGPHEQVVSHIIEAQFVDIDGTGEEDTAAELLEEVPPYLRYAIFSNNPLRFTLLPRVLVNGVGFNANVHTNDNLNLSLSLTSILSMSAVEGFATYAGSLYRPLIFSDPSTAFDPPFNPDGAASLQNVSAIPLPTLDIARMAEEHATRVQPNTIQLLGTTQLGTRAHPEIVHVQGDLIVVDSDFEGYGTFLVDGSVIFEGTATGLASILTGRPETNVAFYTDGPILFNGLGDIQGTFFSNSSVIFSGAATLYGSVIAGGTVDFLLASRIRFTPPSPVLTDILPDDPLTQRLELVAFQEWEVKD